jgi:predicted nucleotidyltransferase
MVDLKEILDVAKIHPKRAISAYVYGSRIYGTYTDESDWDISLIAKNSVESIEIKSDKYNIHIYTLDRWIKDLEWHNPKCLECHFAPENAILLEEHRHKLILELPKLRHAISHTSSNSWVKARKKIESGEYKIGIKSLFHSIRIPMFGSQIAKNSRIDDFSCANKLWKDLCSEEWDWESLDKEYHQMRNNVMSNFRNLAQKL